MELAPQPKRIFVNLYWFKNKVKSKELQHHRDLPLVDPVKGRPKLDFGKCYHLGCQKTFDTPLQLVSHLQKMMCYTRGLHLHHQSIYPPTTIIDFSKCAVCDIDFKTPEGLIEHLSRLGIDGFWKKGETYKDHVLKLRSEGRSEQLQLFGNKLSGKAEAAKGQHCNQLFEAELCLICEEFVPEVMYTKCKHFNICFRCYGLLQDKNTCVYCKSNSSQLFALNPAEHDVQIEKGEVKG